MEEGCKEACYYLLKPFSLVLSSVILSFLQDKRNKHVPFVLLSDCHVSWRHMVHEL